MISNEYKDYIQFDFQDEYNKSPIAFTNPIETIVAYETKEVMACLDRIEEVHRDGKYIAGYMNFEASYAFFNMNIKKQSKPLLWFGVFNHPTTKRINEDTSFHVSKWKPSIDKTSYMDDIAIILDEIKKNSFSQINYTTMWHAKFSGNPYAYYHRLRKAQEANYCAYIQTNHLHILSISPELFFQTRKKDIIVKPMKGTIHRGKTYEEDQANKKWLFHSEKNRMENKLTTDLMKEELQGITLENTTKITKQYTIETYPTVYQMTSEVRGILRDHITFSHIFKTLFPCTSIAGTPKGKALQWIQQLESFDRSIYCGTIGYIAPDGSSTFNVAIRSLIYDEDKQIMAYGAGGAITAQSDEAEEFAEVKAKTAFLEKDTKPFSLLETIGLHDGEFFLLDDHIERLERSARYFSYPVDIPTWRQTIISYQTSHPDGQWKIRLTLQKDGKIQTTITASEEIMQDKQFVFASKPIDDNNIFYYHKTTNRTIYTQFTEQAASYFDVLLWNKKEEITEFTIGNIVIEKDGKLLTPPVSSGILAGTFRKHLLANNIIEEAIIYKEDIHTAKNIWLINSVRKWVALSLQQ